MKFLSAKPEDFREKIYESKSNIFITLSNSLGILLAFLAQIALGRNGVGSVDNLVIALSLWCFLFARSLKPESYPFVNRNIVNFALVLLCLIFGVVILMLYLASEKSGVFTVLIISMLQLEIWIIFTFVTFIILELKHLMNDYDRLESVEGDNKDKNNDDLN